MKNTLIYKHKTTFGTVFLKSRKNGLNPESLYLEIYLKSTKKRHLDFLGLKFTGNPITDTKTKQDAICKCINYTYSEMKTGDSSFTDFCLEQTAKIDKEQSRNGPLRTIKKLHLYSNSNVIQFSQVNESFLLGFRDWLLNKAVGKYTKRPLEKGTADLYLSTIMCFANRAQRKGFISWTAYTKEDIPPIGKVIKAPITFTEGEIIKLQRTAYKKQEICRALMLQFACGQRWGDVRSMEWEQIVFESGQYKVVLKQEKTDKVLPSFISKDLMNWVGEGKERNGKIFTNLPSEAATIIRHLLKWCELAGINKRVGTHTMRRTCATILYKKEVPLLTISKILGHSNTLTTMRYIGIDETDIRKGLTVLKGITDSFSYLKAS